MADATVPSESIPGASDTSAGKGSQQRRAQLEQALVSLRAAGAPASIIQATESELASVSPVTVATSKQPIRDVGKLHRTCIDRC